jgi:hypothetical protein
VERFEELQAEYRMCVYAPARAHRERFAGEPWLANHLRAMSAPRQGFEQGLLSAIGALCDIAAAHEASYAVPIGQDPVMGGNSWLVMARGLLAALTGERGRFDADTFERASRSMARRAGFSEEL